MRIRCSLLFLMLFAIMGCGDGRVKLPTAPVTGTVTYQGKPLTTGRIAFFHPSGQAAGAKLEADGTFKLSAFQGSNRIAIECNEPESDTGGRRGVRPKSLIPERYINYTASGLTLEVKPGEKNTAEFMLTD
jgi:hypothetical protein